MGSWFASARTFIEELAEIVYTGTWSVQGTIQNLKYQIYTTALMENFEL